MKSLATLQYLQELSIADSDLLEDNLSQLNSMKSINELTLDNCPVTSRGLSLLQELLGPNITSLALKGLIINDEDLVHLSGITECVTLDLSDTQVTGSGLTPIPASNLNHLILNGCPLTPVGMKEISQLPFMAYLDINHSHNLTVDTIKALQPDSPLSLSVKDCAFSREELIALFEIPHLVSLDLSHAQFDPAILVEITRATELERLFLEGVPLANADLSSLNKLHKLYTLNLNETELTDEQLKSICPHPMLSQLYLQKTNVTDDSYLLLQLNKCPNLGHLFLQGTSIDEEGQDRFRSTLINAMIEF
ncbi:MAG: hypothetical protein R3C11_20035 [Planctomycetaceae bacterium]